ncbi:fumarylacetoacetate hydrolase family protein [Bacillus sp. JCM 19034]|uniref:fumarylacetoacetate hydrolase family protein n=1 Tax=Bacillus sp. JCM 19034 TaxID=1481928 RepID=UPI0007829315|nr:fumarylacetoacetate hydrolase family protein [Bacillus sp. JCM 19034]
MKLATINYHQKEQAAIVTNEGYLLIETINKLEEKQWPTTVFELIIDQTIKEVTEWYEHSKQIASYEKVEFKETQLAPLYRQPRKIWGIGMNYLDGKPDHVTAYTDPVSFMKPDTSIIGMNDTIHIPKGSTNTTAEAELAIIIGERCKDINEDDAQKYIVGYTSALDMTEADIHAENHRYLTRAKSFDTFLSFGPYLLINEAEELSELTISTVLNNHVQFENSVEHMRYHPHYIVAFHSKVMTLLPGDVILTGTPGAVVIRDGDVVEAHVTGNQTLVNVTKQQ